MEYSFFKFYRISLTLGVFNYLWSAWVICSRQVPVAWAAGGAAAARQPSFAKALGGPQPSGTWHAPSPIAKMCRRKVSSAKGAVQVEPKGDQWGCQLIQLLPKWKWSPRRQLERISHWTKKCKQRGSEEQSKGEQAKVANQEAKDLPVENGDTKNENLASDEAEKKPSLINIIHHVSSVVPVYLVQSISFLVALETFC